MSNERSGKRMKNTSKFISMILRHRPGIIGITLDEHGWADVQELISGVNNSDGHTLDMETLEEIVRTDEKQRYSFNEDHTLIRANQGHSIPVDVELEEKIPPAILWHGTGADPEKPSVCTSFFGHGDSEESWEPARKTCDL